MGKGKSNLKRFDEMPPERHRELSARGGIRSGEVRRGKAALKAEIERVLTVTWLTHNIADKLDDDWKEFKRWQKRRDKAKKAKKS